MKNFSEAQAKKELDKKQRKFSVKDIAKLISKENLLKDKFTNNIKLSAFLADFKLLFSMIKDYAKGNYKTVPWHIISAIGAALLYVLIPIDAIPDFIPVAGLLDDVSVLTFCLKLAGTEIEKYKTWKADNPDTELPAEAGS